MAVHDLLNALTKVKSTGRSKFGATWVACCPSHEDKRPSLTITEKDDGRVLIHCFGGCGAADILAAVGLDFDALFPPNLQDHRGKPVRKPWNPYDLLKLNAFEASIVALTALRMGNGYTLTDDDKKRLLTAHQRLQKASVQANG